jgi:hypothetical protein
MTWFPWRSNRPASSHDEARAALTQSVDDLLGGLQLRTEASHVAERLRRVERRNHLAESIREAFREQR